jgi:hypothetical protein
MVKLATALGGTVRIHIADRETTTIWKDEYPGETLSEPDNVEEVAAKAPKKGRAQIAERAHRPHSRLWRTERLGRPPRPDEGRSGFSRRKRSR